MKKCYSCQTLKPYEDFTRSKTHWDGFKAWCKPCNSKKTVEWQKRNRDKKNAKQARFKANNWEKVRDKHKQYKLDNIEATRAQRVKDMRNRRIRKLQACPPWVNQAVIQEIYDNCPEGMTVDHIMPLRNPILCGLHVPWNLQYLSRIENSIKNNKLTHPSQLCRPISTQNVVSQKSFGL